MSQLEFAFKNNRKNTKHSKTVGEGWQGWQKMLVMDDNGWVYEVRDLFFLRFCNLDIFLKKNILKVTKTTISNPWTRMYHLFFHQLTPHIVIVESLVVGTARGPELQKIWSNIKYVQDKYLKWFVFDHLGMENPDPSQTLDMLIRSPIASVLQLHPFLTRQP